MARRTRSRPPRAIPSEADDTIVRAKASDSARLGVVDEWHFDSRKPLRGKCFSRFGLAPPCSVVQAWIYGRSFRALDPQPGGDGPTVTGSSGRRARTRLTKKARRASYCRWVKLDGSRNRRDKVKRSLELSVMVPRCHPDRRASVDAILSGESALKQGQDRHRASYPILPMFRRTSWQQRLSFLAGDNKANRAEARILERSRSVSCRRVNWFRLRGNPG